MSREFVGGWYLEVAVEKFAKSLVIDVLEQEDSLSVVVIERLPTKILPIDEASSLSAD